MQHTMHRPTHQPMHGPACQSPKSQSAPPTTEGHQDYVILLLVFSKSAIVHETSFWVSQLFALACFQILKWVTYQFPTLLPSNLICFFFSFVNINIFGEWRGLAVSIEDCHSKGWGFQPWPFRNFLLQTLFEQLRDQTWRSRARGKLRDDLVKTNAGAAREDGRTGRWTRQMGVRKDKTVQRRRESWGSRFKSIKLSTPSMVQHGEKNN